MDDDAENRHFSRFERAEEFLGLLSKFLAFDLTTEPTEEQNEEEDALVIKLTLIVGL